MAIIASVEVFDKFTSPKFAAPDSESHKVENPRSLPRGQRARLEWITRQLIHSEVETTSVGKGGEEFSFMRQTAHNCEDSRSVIGTITKALPETSRLNINAQTLHFTPDPVVCTAENGKTHELTQPPLVIPEISYGDFIVTALQKVV